MSEEKLSVFPMGEKNDAYVAIIGISIIKAGRYCLSQADEVIIRSGGNRPGS